MHSRRNSSEKILVCIPSQLLKQIEKLKTQYKSRSELVREALELLIASHTKKNLERELKEGFKILKNLHSDFAEKSLAFNKEMKKE